ncbi:MAG: hypothetical protein IKJ65_09060 [Clostridia bacterium]|nr:hypothetical protein [Clostridia bacterium]
MEITIIQAGLTEDELTLGAIEALKSAKRIILHTERCGASEWLKKNHVSFSSLDSVYEEAEDFDEHIDMALDRILSENAESIHYVVIDMDDETVRALADRGVSLRFIGQKTRGGLTAFSKGAYLTVSATDAENAYFSSLNDTLITEIDSYELASDVKLLLMDKYPDETDVYFLKDNVVTKIPLMDLDRMKAYDHTAACFVPAVRDLLKLERYDFEHLLMLARRLRDPVDGCPWDKEQTHESLKRDALEEAYELQDAIEKGDEYGLVEELGDVLFAVALQIQIGIEHGEFTGTDVITGVVQKMISRHSHVFGKDSVSNLDGLFSLWDDNKKEEKGFKNTGEEMEAVALALPALLRAGKVIKRAEKADNSFVPTAESYGAADAKTLGDSLLRQVAWARQNGIDAEKALEDAVNRYIACYKAAHSM